MLKKKHTVRDWLKHYITRPYTVVIVPDNSERPIQFRLRIGVLTIGTAVIAGMVIAIAVFGYYGSRYHQVNVQNKVLVSSNEEQKEKLDQLGEAQKKYNETERLLAEAYSQLEELMAENTMQKERIAELSLITEDTMNQLEEILLMQNELRVQLGFKEIESMGGPREVSRVEEPLSARSMAWEESLEEISEKLGYITEQIANQKAGLLEISDRMDSLMKIPARWPVDSRNITSEFGSRSNPFGGSSTENHWGIDVGCSWGAPIYAAGQGEVIVSEWESGYGYTVVIDHGNGYISRYSHCSSLSVEAGNIVEAGDIIAKVGSTGRSTGPHLDFRIQYNGEYVDPLQILRE